jgi:DNA-binding transcriptional regulator YiaG
VKPVPLYRLRAVVGYTLVDDDDYELVSKYRWNLNAGGYPFSSEAGMPMHRLILDLAIGDPQRVHHRNEEKVDNRRANLQVCANAAEVNRQPHPKTRGDGAAVAAARTPFACQLRLAMVARGVTPEQFAREIGASLRLVQKWRSGIVQPRIARQLKIARYFGRSLDSFHEAAA